MMKHGSSGVVTIPMSYRKYHDLNPGDEMIVMYDSLILMAPRSMEHIVEDRQELIDELLGMMKKPLCTEPGSPPENAGHASHHDTEAAGEVPTAADHTVGGTLKEIQK